MLEPFDDRESARAAAARKFEPAAQSTAKKEQTAESSEKKLEIDEDMEQTKEVYSCSSALSHRPLLVTFASTIPTALSRHACPEKQRMRRSWRTRGSWRMR